MMRAVLLDPTTPQGMILLEILGESSGMLESACLRSGIYSVTDLQALVDQDGNSGKHAKRIIAGLAMYDIVTRRTGPEPSESVKHAYDRAVADLNDLSIGVRIFAFEETAAAGLPSGGQFNAQIYYANNFISQRYGAFFGTRSIDQRYGGWGWGGAGGIIG
jgi:hypothetical protein